MLECPSGLLEQLAGHLDTVSTEVHVAPASGKTHGVVVEAGDCGEESRLGGDLLSSDRVVPREGQVEGRLSRTKLA